MFKVLVLEDNDKDIEVLASVIERLNIEAREEKYSFERAKSVDEALKKLEQFRVDGIIVDISLRTEIDDKGMPNGKDGTEFINSVTLEYRIPMAVYSATPEEDLLIKTFMKGSSDYESVITYLEKMQETKIFDVIGGKGLFERKMSQIFWNNLFPQVEIWSDYAEWDRHVENKLLRYALSHMIEMLDESIEYYSEEMYIKPVVVDMLKTGCIITDENGNKQIVLSPPCDLAVHNGIMKTDIVITCDIEPLDNHISRIARIVKNRIKKQQIPDEKKQQVVEEEKKKSINNLVTNRDAEYYHWLPSNKLFEGGVINFRKVNRIEKKNLSKFDCKSLKIQDSFVKNIQNRFSMYYARQGQPDFDFTREVDILLEKCR